jgi:hypothetical protein
MGEFKRTYDLPKSMNACALLPQRDWTQKKCIKRTKFLAEEDEQIRAQVERFGASAWEKVAEAMENRRTKRQLRERWQNYLSPSLEPAYTETEDQVLVALYRVVGPHWARIAALIGKKSAISARNRYRALQSMKARGMKPDYEQTAA